MNKRRIGLPFLVTLNLFMSGCGDDESQNQVISSTFIDSAVSGLTYACGEQEGTTDLDGKYFLNKGSVCNFNLNGFAMGSYDSSLTQSSIVTPYDVAKNKDEAIRMASLLQSIDEDGYPDNGITISQSFDSSLLNPDLLNMDENEFIASLLVHPDVNVVVGFDQAKKHLDLNVGLQKGYHSSAVQEIVDDVTQILPQLETVNLESKLSFYKQVLEKGDSSNNQDIETLKAILNIAEVINDPLVAERLSFEELKFNYTEMLPKLLDHIINDAKPILNDTAKGTTADVAQIFYQYSQTLVLASNELADSFSDPNYVAMYSQNEDFHVNSNDAKEIQVLALSTANALATFAAYQYGSDEYFLPVAETVNVDLIEISYNGEAPVIKYNEPINVEYLKIGIDPQTYYNDLEVGTLRQDPKFLKLAKTSLSQATEVALTIDYSDEGLAEDELAELIEYLNRVNNHLKAIDGKKEPLIYESETDKWTVNLHAFYSVDKGIDRNDFDYIYEYLDTISENHSKLLGFPTQETQNYVDENNYPIQSKTSFVTSFNDKTIFTNAIAINYDFDIEPKASIEDVIIQCETKVRGIWEPCF